jgi:hypothetical protein
MRLVPTPEQKRVVAYPLLPRPHNVLETIYYADNALSFLPTPDALIAVVIASNAAGQIELTLYPFIAKEDRHADHLRP